MLFNLCNCVSPSAFADAGHLCAGGAGFVTAMMAALAANNRTQAAKTLSGEVPVVDRLSVRIVTDNMVIQFVPTEKRDGFTIERRTATPSRTSRPARRCKVSGAWPCMRNPTAATRPATS